MTHGLKEEVTAPVYPGRVSSRAALSSPYLASLANVLRLSSSHQGVTLQLPERPESARLTQWINAYTPRLKVHNYSSTQQICASWLYYTMPSQASTILHKAGFVVFMISLPLELLCKSVDSPDLLTTSPLRLHHSAPSQASDGSSQNPLGDLQTRVITWRPNHLEAFLPLIRCFLTHILVKWVWWLYA